MQIEYLKLNSCIYCIIKVPNQDDLVMMVGENEEKKTNEVIICKDYFNSEDANFAKSSKAEFMEMLNNYEKAVCCFKIVIDGYYREHFSRFCKGVYWRNAESIYSLLRYYNKITPQDHFVVCKDDKLPSLFPLNYINADDLKFYIDSFLDAVRYIKEVIEKAENNTLTVRTVRYRYYAR